MVQSAMKISVIIPVCNRVEPLILTLSGLVNQTIPRAAYDVIVVDDGSSDDCRRQIRQQTSAFHVTFFEKEHSGLAGTRNYGADRASGDILYFLDDDVIPGADAVQQHLRSHAAHSEPVAVVGALPFLPSARRNSFLAYMDRRNHYDLYRDPTKYPGGVPPLPPMNGNSSIRKDLFYKVGKYDEAFRMYGGEDLDLGYRLAQAGVKFIYNPYAVGYHNHTKQFAQFCADMEQAGESLIHIFRRYPEIKVMKKIDILVDPLSALSGRKKIVKLIFMITIACPWLLALPRLLTRLGEPYYALRGPLFPLFRWISDYHYALGMRRRLAA